MPTSKSKKPKESLHKSNLTREIYKYVDKENKINITSKEIYKKQDKIVHYPFDKRTGEPKYPTIKRITYLDFKKLPRGILKEANTGYGFTRIFNPLLYYLQDKFEIESVVLNNKPGVSSLDLDKKAVIFNFSQLDKFYPEISNLFDVQKADIANLISELLSRIFPAEVVPTEKKYIKNTIVAFINKWKIFSDDFGEEDVKSLTDLFNKVSSNHDIITSKTILKTREVIEELFIEDVIKTFEEFLKQKTETEQLEEKWQTFFKDNTWIFAQLLSFPVILYEDKAYVGGKDISNRGGKVSDFLIKNNLTNNVAFIEIKTHQSNLLKGAKAYRGKDVYSISDDLTGAINQVLDQRDNFQKEFYALKAKSKKPVETYNSKCVVIIGMVGNLSEDELKSFELFRSNSKDVEIITFDELFGRIKVLHELMVGNS
jgi:hypothetical protein